MIRPARLLANRAGRISSLWHIRRPECEVTLRVRQRLWVVAFVFTLACYLIRPAAPVLAGVIVLGSLLLAGLWWARAMAVKVTGSRSLRYTAFQVGDELEEALLLDNRSGLPVLWAEFVDRSNAPGYTIAGVHVAGRHLSTQWRAHTTCTRRGVFTLGPWELRLGDPFGLFDVKQVYSQQTEVLVYPPLAALSPELLPRRRKVGDLQRWRQAVSAETVEVAATRPYLLGDPLRRVHWRTTARQNKLFVKVCEPEASSIVWLIPDLDAAAHLGEGADSSLETMVVLTASLAAHLLAERLAVGLMLDAQHGWAQHGWASTDTPSTILPQYGQTHLWSILRALAMVQPISDRPFDQALIEASALISARDSVVALTPSLSPDWPRALTQIVGGQSPFGAEAVVLDPASFGAPAGADAFALLLADLGITAHVVRREEVQPITGTYGEVRRWEFMTLGTGRVIVRQTPRSAPTSP